MHDYRTQFSDPEWAAILNHAISAGLTIDATVHRFVSAAPALLEFANGFLDCEFGQGDDETESQWHARLSEALAAMALRARVATGRIERSPAFSNVTDAELIAQAASAQRQLAEARTVQDATDDFVEHIDAGDERNRLEQLASRLGDELCARGLG